VRAAGAGAGEASAAGSQGGVVIDFEESTHTYSLHGQRVPSVTQVLDQLGTYVGIPADVLARKAEIGDAVHYATELHDRGELDPLSVPDEIAGYMVAYLKFREQTGFEPTVIEQIVHSDRYRFAGRLDRIGTFSALRRVKPGALCMVDLKCTYRLMPAGGPQTAAYSLAWMESRNERNTIKHRFALRLAADGTFELKEHTDPTDLPVFLAALTLHHFKQRHAA
jgi:hypothetical protein